LEGSVRVGHLRNIKRVRLLETIYRDRTSTRGALSDQTGLTPTSTIRLIAELRDLGLVRAQAETELDRPGRPKERLSINPRSGVAVGLEFGRDVAESVITDALGDVIDVRTHRGAPPFASTRSTMMALAALIRDAAIGADISWSDVCAVGLALHDVVTSQGEWSVWGDRESAPFPARSFLVEHLGVVATVEDVSRAIAQAEHRSGVGRGAPDMICLFVGNRNVGAGVFVNGALMRSASGVCGEIGHIIVDDDGPLCQCGNRGCFEAVSSGDAVVARYLRLLDQGLPSTVARNDVDFTTICAASARGEKAASLVVHELAERLGKALASSISVTGANLVIIGGPLRLAGPNFTTLLAGILRNRVIPSLAPAIEVVFASDEGHFGALGAAHVALDEAWAAGSFLEKALRVARP
jgi:N-acetylglucosamine repressor